MKNIIFDFGNVLVRWQPERVYAEYFGNEARSWFFLRHVADATWRNRIDAGESQEKCIAELQQVYPEYAAAIEVYRSRWAEMLTGEVEGMREVLQELQAGGVPIYGLTNWSMETFPQARERFGILQMVEHYVVSGAEGMVKPDARLFGVLLERYGLKAEECVFVDDNPANVEAARRLGMEGIVFEGAEMLRVRLGLMRGLTAGEVQQLERQGNTAQDWNRVVVSPQLEVGRIVRSHFGGDVKIGAVEKIEACTVVDSSVGDGCVLCRVGLLQGYHLGYGCRIEGVGEMSCSSEPVGIAVMNENGGRRVQAVRGMTVGDAYIWARYRDRAQVMGRFEEWAAKNDGRPRGEVGDNVCIRNAVAIVDSMIGEGCSIGHGVIAERVFLGENVKLEAGLRINDTVVGDNSTLARGEVGNSVIFPSHEQHHNNSFLIAALTMGQSNVAAGCTLGSNHNGRTADGELAAGRGFWPGLCSSVKHSSRFASYTLLVKGDYPSELNITLPFSLVNNNVHRDRLEVMPAYWWMYNMYALNRNITKFADRDRRQSKRQHIEYSPFAPDTAEEMLVGRGLLHLWTTRAYQDGGSTEVVAYGMERGGRKTVVLKPGEAYQAYWEMLVYYAMQQLVPQYGGAVPPAELGEGERVQRWVNVGGQLVQGADMDALLKDIEGGIIASWVDLHTRLDQLWADYPMAKVKHAYQVLCELSQLSVINEAEWKMYSARYAEIQQLVRDRIHASRQKDASNEFRQTTFWNSEEMRAVLGN